MIAPAPPPSFFPPSFQPYNDGVGFWQSQETPLERQESESPNPNFPPLKKQRNSENEPSIPCQNPILNQTLNQRISAPSNNPPVMKGISKMFFKTRICEKFRLGTCPYGSNCNFAHGVDEIRKPPPNWKELVAAHEDDRGVGNWTEQQRIINKLKICRKFFYGEGCPYGDNCNFLHEDGERVRESAAVMVCNNGNWLDHREGNRVVNSVQDNTSSDAVVISVVDNNANSISDDKPVYWKTKICNKWEVTGYCPFGDKCHFAHGLAELQRFGRGNMEVDSGNVVVAPSKLLPVSTNYISPSKTLMSSSIHQARGMNRLAKLSESGLISHIYADWIDQVQHLDSSRGRLKDEL